MKVQLAREDLRLERRPEATSFAVDDLLAAVEDGRVRVPNFQRGMRWDDADRIDLLDSVWRGFPIGTLLLWKRAAPAGEVRWGRYVIDAPERPDALWVVDGQQRLTALVEALLAPAREKARGICFDLRDDRFVWSRSAFTDVSSFLVPASVLLDTTTLMEWATERRDLRAQDRQRVFEVGKRLREYRIPAYIVEADDESVLRVVFARTNRSGKSLTEAEVFRALYEPTTAVSTFERVRRGVASLGWGELDDDEILRPLLAIEGLPMDRALPQDLDPQRMATALSRTERALRSAALFLQTAAIPHAGLNPYSLPLVVLARFFDAFPEPALRSLTLLRRWLWRGMEGLRLAGAVIDLRRHLRCVVHGEEHGSVQRLLALAPTEADTSIFDLSPVNLRTARTLIQVCALAALRPRDMRTGLSVDVGALVDEKALLGTVEGAPSEDLASRLLHPPSDLCAAIVGADEASLRSHAISDEAVAALRRGDVDAFVAERGATLRRWFDAFYARQAEWGADDSPPLAALVDEEEP
ncbi:MAG: DUF262 domain-containing protein [Polyangiales bacterium]